MTVLKNLNAKNKFEDDAIEQANELVTSLGKQKLLTSQKIAKTNICGKKQRRLEFFVKNSLEISPPQSDSVSESEEG